MWWSKSNDISVAVIEKWPMSWTYISRVTNATHTENWAGLKLLRLWKILLLLGLVESGELPSMVVCEVVFEQTKSGLFAKELNWKFEP